MSIKIALSRTSWDREWNGIRPPHARAPCRFTSLATPMASIWSGFSSKLCISGMLPSPLCVERGRTSAGGAALAVVPTRATVHVPVHLCFRYVKFFRVSTGPTTIQNVNGAIPSASLLSPINRMFLSNFTRKGIAGVKNPVLDLRKNLYPVSNW